MGGSVRRGNAKVSLLEPSSVAFSCALPKGPAVNYG
jgi:hypothetical protein